MASASGVTGIANVGSTAALTLNNLASVVTVDVNTNSSVTTLNFSNAALAGTNTLTINLDGVSDAGGANTGDIILTSAAGAANTLETVAVVSRSVSNTIETLYTTGVGATALNISGDQNLTIADALNNEVVTVSAGDATGALSFTVGTGGVAVTTGSGADSVVGGTGNDNISGGAGNDTVDGSTGADTIGGGDGNDQITGGTGVDVLTGGADNDTFLYAAAADLIAATAGADAAIDSVVGGDGNDVVSVAAAISIGVAGADSLARITGVETLTQTAGAGSTVVIASDAALSDFRTINVSAASAANTVTLTGVTVGVSVLASGSGDTITVGSGADTITGGAGADSITGGDGADSITTGAGQDTVSSGVGNDTIIGGANVTDADLIVGGADTDTLTLSGDYTAGSALSTASTISEVENITVATGHVTSGTARSYSIAVDNDNNVDTGAAVTTDVLTIDASALKAAEDLNSDGDSTDGNEAAETLTFTAATASSYSVSVTGGAGNDTITGSTLADTIVGGSGNDSITGGAGSDSLDGGAGSDEYVYANTHFVAADVIADTGASGTDSVSITSTTAVTDAMFANKTGLESATLASAVTYTLGANAQAAGITSVTMSAAGTLVASDYTVGLSVTDAGATPQTITTGSGADTVTLTTGANDVVTLGAGDDTLAGGAAITAADTLTGGTGTDVLTLAGGATAGNVVATSITFDSDFSGFEQITVGAGLTATAVANANDTAGSVNDYTLALVDANVVAATTFSVDASALRTTITTGLGGDNEIGGTGANADTTTGEENLSLNASALTGTRSVSVLGGAGNDTIQGGAGADTITGNAGADSLVGNAGADFITGGDGNDTITGGDGADSLDGGNGNDTFVQTISQFNGDADTISGGTGTNTLELSTTAAVTIADVAFNGRLSGITNVTVSDNSSDTVTWTLGAYSQAAGVTTVTVGATTVGVIDATSYGVAITLAGDAGADTLTGSALNDTITGGAGADSITGNAGNDNINGGAGANVIDAGTGDDTVTITDVGDSDSVTLGTGNDTVVGGAAVSAGDTLTGGTGTDVLSLAGDYTLTTDGDFTGFETITLSSGVQAVAVDGGNDTIGDAYIYSITLGDATNVASGTTMTVDASALTAATILTTLGGNEIGGDDDSTTDETLTLTATAVSGSVSVLGGAGNDTVSGSAQADTITGNGGADSLVGAGGSDVISGGDGADTVTGGADADTITLGAGADVVIIDSVANSTGTTYDTITDFVTGTDKINITLTTSDNSFDVSGFAVVSNFNDGIVSLSTSRGDAFYSTADGKLYVDDNGSGSINASLDHVVSMASVAASDINFSITGAGSANTIVGGAGADTIDGAAGADSLTGGAGNDNITGGNGADTIIGGTGADTIVLGSEGATTDVVRLAAGDSSASISLTASRATYTGVDTVTGFQLAGGDLLDLAGTLTLAGNTAGTNGTDSTAVLSAGGSDVIKSHAISATGLTTFDDADTFATAVALGDAGDVGAAIEYLSLNDIGDAGATVVFAGSGNGGASYYVYQQTASTAGATGGYILVELVGVSATGGIEVGGTTASTIVLG
jgi:Ca2+-binding RTX toxin-like protein